MPANSTTRNPLSGPATTHRPFVRSDARRPAVRSIFQQPSLFGVIQFGCGQQGKGLPISRHGQGFEYDPQPCQYFSDGRRI